MARVIFATIVGIAAAAGPRSWPGWESISSTAAQAPERHAGLAARKELERLDALGLSPQIRPELLNVSGFEVRPHDMLGSKADNIDRLVTNLYAKQGYTVARSSYSGSRVLVGLRIGAAVDLADVELFVRLCAVVKPRRIFGIGNSFGYSSFILSYACDNAALDVLDAELGPDGNANNDDNRLGSELTRKIARDEGRNLRLHVGFSPQGTAEVLRKHNGSYDLALVDGWHKDHNVILDFLATRRALGPSAVVIFHDVGHWNLWRGVRKVLRAQPSAKYRTFHGRWAENYVGTGFAYWGFPDSAFSDFGPLFDPRKS